jgi:hypothetical protein
MDQETEKGRGPTRAVEPAKKKEEDLINIVIIMD